MGCHFLSPGDLPDPGIEPVFPGGSDGKASAYNAGDLGSIPGSGRSPGERKWQPTPIFLPGKFQGQRSPAGYSPWDCEESDVTV